MTDVDDGVAAYADAISVYKTAIANGDAGAFNTFISFIQKALLEQGSIPETEEEAQDLINLSGTCGLRGTIWKICVQVPPYQLNDYLMAIGRGPSLLAEKINNDTFRTFKTDESFKVRCPEAKMKRLLNVFVHECSETGGGNSYVQGMNVHCGLIGYCMPEIDAYYTMKRVLTCFIPTYVSPSLDGAFAGCHLIDECLKACDKELYDHLRKHNLIAQIYAFQHVLTLCGSMRPLSECVKLWDLFFAFGFHLGVLCVTTIVLDQRAELLASESPMKLLQNLPELRAAHVVQKVIPLAKALPSELYDKVAAHVHNKDLARELKNKALTFS